MGVTIVRKGVVDVITDGKSGMYSFSRRKAIILTTRSLAAICSTTGCPRRCGGQGDILAGAMATFVAWSHHLDGQQCDQNQSNAVVACLGACAVTREAARLAFAQEQRSTLASAIVTCMGSALDSVIA